MIDDSPNNVETLEYHEVKKRSVSGVIALVSRTFVIQLISFVATLALTYYLDPQVYGIFYLVSSVVNFLSYFSDIGLAAALIQKRRLSPKMIWQPPLLFSNLLSLLFWLHFIF